MDTLTHALSGALLARATEPSSARPHPLPRRTRMWVGFWSAAFPDSDFILRFIDPLTYLTTHRGVTHSVILLPLWALGLAALFALLTRRKDSWREFAAIAAMGIAIHIAGDVITAFGTMVFAPVSDLRVAFPTTFIIDPYFSAIVVAGLLASIFWKHARYPAVAGLATLVAYVGFQGWLHERAVAAGAAYAAEQNIVRAAIHAQPQPFSPFNWMVVVAAPDAYYLSYVSLSRDIAPAMPPADANWLRRINAIYYPVADARWHTVARFGAGPHAQLALALWNGNELGAYRRFTLFPALYRVDDSGHQLCIWFQDVRFLLPGRDVPFRYGACRAGAEMPWQVYQLVSDGEREFSLAVP